MLFILYGATLEMGFQCREMFKGFGFDIIRKYNYIEDDTKLNKSLYESPEQDSIYARWYNDKQYAASREEIEQCDFRYGLDGVCLGFNKEQILNAVHGANDALLTVGAASLEFVIQLKKAYGDYVTLINLFSDSDTVRHDNRLSGSMTEQELAVRDAANRRMQEIYLKNIDEFDEVVLYTGGETTYDPDALKLQFESIIQKRRAIENQLNNRTYVELPYKGKEDYIFVSYAHRDKEKVYTELMHLQRSSFRIWYDDGIRGGENWRRIIADKLVHCSQFLLFLSGNSVASEDVEAEIVGALDLHKEIIIVNLDNTQLPFEYRMYLKNINQISYLERDYRRKLHNALLPKMKTDE